MRSLRLNAATCELSEKGSRRIKFPMRISVLGVPATAATCADLSELTDYVMAHHASALSAAEIADYVRNFCLPLGLQRDRVSG